LDLKAPWAQASQMRSLLVVAAAWVKVPAAHLALTGAQTAPLSSVENASPAVHTAHWRSAVAEPASDIPLPTEHVAHGAHASVASVPALASALKVPAEHTPQVRSLLVVATAEVNVPSAQAELVLSQASPLTTAEYDVPASQAAHWRLAVAEPSTDLPWPAGHVAQAVQVSVIRVPALMLDLKVPDAQASHSRSLLTVAPLVVKVPGPHGALTTVHASPLFAGENVEPATHPAHWRSAMAEPAADMPWPTAHVAHAAHSSTASVVLVLALKVPSAQLAHCRSLLAVAAAVVWKPAVHGALTAAHAEPSVVAENVAPAWQAAHWRSAVAEPTEDMPCPTVQVAHVAHDSLPAAALNEPAGHAEHTRLDVSVGAMISYSPAAHVVMSRHTRSVVVVAAVKMY
jgi:hypothetical protein